MLANSLYNYYEGDLANREAVPSDHYGADAIAAPYFEISRVGIEVVLDNNGKIKSINEIDWRKEIIPYVARTAAPLPRFCCDKLDYFTSEKKYKSFREYHERYLADIKNKTVKVFLKFLYRNDSKDIIRAIDKFKLDKDALGNTKVVFRISSNYLHRLDSVVKKWKRICEEWLKIETVEGIDVITGKISKVSKKQPVAFNSLKMYSDNKKSTKHYGLDLVAPTSFETTLKCTRAMEELKNNAKSRINFSKSEISILYWTISKQEDLMSVLTNLMMNGEKNITKDTLDDIMKKYQALTLSKHPFGDLVNVLTVELPDKGHIKFISYDVIQLDIFTENVVEYTALFQENYSKFYKHPSFIPSVFCVADVMGKLRSNQYEVFKTLMDFVAYKKPLPRWFEYQLLNSILKAEWEAKNGNGYNLKVLVALLFTIGQFKMKDQKGDNKMNEDNSLYFMGQLVALNECARESHNINVKSMTRGIFVNPARHLHQVNTSLENVFATVSRKNRGRSIWLRRLCGDVMSQLQGKQLPSRATNDDKNAYYFGYYDMKNRFYKKKPKEEVVAEKQ